MSKKNNKDKISKILLLLVMMPLALTITTGGIEYRAYQIDAKEGIFQTKTQKITEPVIDVDKLEEVEEVDIDENQTNETTELVLTDVKDKESTTIDDEVLFGVENEEKEKTNAGQKELSVVTPNLEVDEIGSYVLTQEGSIEEEKAQENVANEIQVQNNKIISADQAIVSTVGGVDKVIYAYSSIEDAENKENGIPLSGGAFDAQYIKTLEDQGQYYVQILISGFEGYISLEDVQIIPTSLIKSQSHYENIEGNWVYFEATDPLKEDSYLTYEISSAPEWSVPGESYISYDDVNYELLTTGQGTDEQDFEVVSPGDGGGNSGGNNGGNSGGGNTTSYSYFENLPFTSTSSYTGSQYKSYLKHIGYTNSEYYNYTDAFVEAQDKENVNSLYLFAMANHESLYGTSEYARTCNNFFGYGAFDSNPDNACGKYGYSTPRDGILAQGIHLTQQWGDITDDFRWAGTELGNKQHGVNVTYASDSNWGKKIASHMRDIDTYLNHKEEGYYKIYEITSEQYVYSSYSKNEKLKVETVDGKQENYMIPRSKGNPRVLVTGTNSDYFQFQVPTPINNSSATTCKWSDANSGSYPNYGKTYSINVPKGTASFACDYGNWTQQQAWYPTHTSSGSKTYNVISNASSKDPWVGSSSSASVCNKVSDTTYVDGNKVENWVSTDGNEKCKVTYYGKSSTRKEYVKYYYNSSNKKYKRTIYRYDSNGKKDYYANTNYSTSTGKITDYKEYFYNNSEDRIQRNEKTYSSNGNSKKYVKYYYNNSLKLHNRQYYTYDSNGKKDYYANTNYSTSTGKITDYKEYFYNTKGTRIQRNEKYYDSKGYGKYKYYYYYDSNGKFVSSKKVTY